MQREGKNKGKEELKMTPLVHLIAPLNVSNLPSVSPAAGNDVLQCLFKVPKQTVCALQPSSSTSALTRPDPKWASRPDFITSQLKHLTTRWVDNRSLQNQAPLLKSIHGMVDLRRPDTKNRLFLNEPLWNLRTFCVRAVMFSRGLGHPWRCRAGKKIKTDVKHLSS